MREMQQDIVMTTMYLFVYNTAHTYILLYRIYTSYVDEI